MKYAERTYRQNQSQLIQAVLTFIVTNITTHDEIKELENLFKKLDTNQDGKLSKDELMQGSFMLK